MLAEYVVLGDEDEVRRRWEKVFEVPLVDGSVTMNFIFEEQNQYVATLIGEQAKPILGV